MRRLLSILFLLLAVRGFGAAGDFINAQVDASGWQLWLNFDSMSTNGTFSTGFASNNNWGVSSPKVTLALTSQGFDSSANATTFTRTLYGTKGIRFVWPSNAYPDVVQSGSTTTVKIALSDFVYVGDSNLTVTLVSGLYAAAGTNSAAGSSLVVTNNSVRLYPIPVANWTWPGWNRETNATMRLRAVGFAQTADGGQPLACMQFIVSDGITRKTNTESRMRIDRTLPDALPTAEYFTDISLSGFVPYAVGGAAGTLWCDFAAYPRLGNASTVKLTTNSLAGLMPRAVTITNLCDTNSVYSKAVAVVDPAGSDANGRVTNNANPALVDSARYFLTVRGACLQIQATNNALYGHNDPGGGIMYVRTGISNWSGATGDITTTPASWLNILPYPGDTMTGFTNQSGSFYAGNRVKMSQMPLGGGQAANLFGLTTGFWMDQCNINSLSANFYRGTMWYVTDCTIPSLPQGLSFVAGLPVVPALVRGNTLGYNVGNSFPVYLWLGNLMTSNILCSLSTDFSGQTTPFAYGSILYNNRLNMHTTGLATRYSLFAYHDMDANGAAIVQNVFENSTNDTGALLSLGAGYNVTNIIVWHNLTLGQRDFCFYNYDTGANFLRWQCQMLNNMFDNYDLKSDLPLTVGARTNNWEEMFGVNWQGNVWMETTNPGTAPASFLNSMIGGFPGLNTIENTTVKSPYWPKFVDRQAYDGSSTNSWPGGGNYRVNSDAPMQGLGVRWVLPYDIEGNARGALDPPGAYASASPRKGGLFFAQ